MCLKNYKKIIDYVFFKNAKKKVKPAEKPWMCLEEAQNICF